MAKNRAPVSTENGHVQDAVVRTMVMPHLLIRKSGDCRHSIVRTFGNGDLEHRGIPEVDHNVGDVGDESLRSTMVGTSVELELAKLHRENTAAVIRHRTREGINRVCEICSNKISPARAKQASTCIDCQEKNERHEDLVRQASTKHEDSENDSISKNKKGNKKESRGKRERRKDYQVESDTAAEVATVIETLDTE